MIRQLFLEWKYISRGEIHFLIHAVAVQYKQFDIYHVFVFFLKTIRKSSCRWVLSFSLSTYQQWDVIKCARRSILFYGTRHSSSSSFFFLLRKKKFQSIRLTYQVYYCYSSDVYTQIILKSNTKVEARVSIKCPFQMYCACAFCFLLKVN